jgi:hypothetical protein
MAKNSAHGARRLSLWAAALDGFAAAMSLLTLSMPA